MEDIFNLLIAKSFARIADVPCGSGSHKLTFPEEAVEMYLDGKGRLENGDYVHAYPLLLCAQFEYDKYYGKLANECGEVYFLYGLALYHLSRKEMRDGEVEEINKAEEFKKEKELSESTDSPPSVFNEGLIDTEASKFAKESGSQKEVSLNDASDGVAEENKMDEGIINKLPSDYAQKLALKYLEDAKLIFERRGTGDAELKVANILQVFASIHKSNGNYTSAISEYKKSVNIYETHLKPDDEILAQTFFMMGLLHKAAQMYPEALKYLQQSKHIYGKEYGNLSSLLVVADKTSKREIKHDILDYHMVLKDIQKDIEDIEELMNKNELMET